MILMMMIAMILMAMILVMIDDDDDDDDDDDNLTLGIPETQKSPSMAWKNFTPFYNSHRSVNLPSYVLPPFFFFLLPLSKIKMGVA